MVRSGGWPGPGATASDTRVANGPVISSNASASVSHRTRALSSELVGSRSSSGRPRKTKVTTSVLRFWYTPVRGPTSTLTRVSSKTSRAAASRIGSPGSTIPPGVTQAPVSRRCTASRRPSARKTTAPALTEYLPTGHLLAFIPLVDQPPVVAAEDVDGHVDGPAMLVVRKACDLEYGVSVRDSEELRLIVGGPAHLDLLGDVGRPVTASRQALVERGRVGVRVGGLGAARDFQRDVGGGELHGPPGRVHVPLSHQYP